MASPSQRLDKRLIELNLAPTRSNAQQLIRQAKVLLNGSPETRPAAKVFPHDQITLTAPEPFVSRAGKKLQAALEHFSISVANKRFLDIGCSTGGFTDCLLQKKALHVTGIDVGHDQISPSLKNHPRFTLHEGVNARHIIPSEFTPPRYDGIVIDVSFISQLLILPAVLPLASDSCDLITLIKPQFEVGKENLARTGIVRNNLLHTQTIDRIKQYIDSLPTWNVQDVIPSPILGGDGNKEFLLWANR